MVSLVGPNNEPRIVMPHAAIDTELFFLCAIGVSDVLPHAVFILRAGRIEASGGR